MCSWCCVCSCARCSQVLGEMQLGGKVMQRWLAHSIRSVLTKKYPSLRVAYIDLENLGQIPARDPTAAAAAAAAGPGQPVMAGSRERGRGSKAHRLLRQYSVLLQHDGQHDAVVELYRSVGLAVIAYTTSAGLATIDRPEGWRLLGSTAVQNMVVQAVRAAVVC
jgi:hypothetical protein